MLDIASHLLAKNRLSQVVFTFKETIKLAFRISPGYLILILVLNTIWGLSTLPSLYLDKLIIDRVVSNIGNPAWQTVFEAILTLVVLRMIIEVARNLLSRTTDFLRSNLSRVFSMGIEILLGKKMTELDVATLDSIEFKNRYNKIEQEAGSRSYGLIVPLANIPNYLSGFLGAVGLLILLHPLVAVAVLLISLPQFLVDSKFIKKEYELRTLFAPLYRLWGWLSWLLQKTPNMMELKILRLGVPFAQRLQVMQKEIIGRRLALAKEREIYHVLVYLPTVLLEIILFVWLILLTLWQKITIGSMQMYLQAVRSAQMNLAGLVSSFLEIYENYLYVVDLIWFFNLKPMINQESGKRLPCLDEEINFKGVWFRYRQDTPWILKNINFTIKPGERLAIVGENGAGKSTLIKLLARFYDPEKGQILIGKKDLKDLHVGDWHKHLAILFQRFEGYPFTARESIGYGDIERVGVVRG